MVETAKRSASKSKKSLAKSSKMIKNPSTGRMVKADGVVAKQIRMERSLQLHKPSSAGRGGRTRGWSTMKPNRGAERLELRGMCGNKCFLKPSSLGFPVCAAVDRSTPAKICKPRCSGITSAKVRAAQWGYKDIEHKASRLEEKYECKKKASRRSKK